MIRNLKLSQTMKPMNAGGGKGDDGGGSAPTAGSVSQRVWEPQGQQLNSMYSKLSDQGHFAVNESMRMAPNSTRWMNQIGKEGMGGWQDQLAGGVYQDMDLQNSLMDSLNQSMAGPSNTQEINNMIMGGEGNNYADAMRDQYINDANIAQNNMMQNLDARANAAGMAGGSRHGVQQAAGMQNINSNLQSNLAQVGYDTFDKDLNRKLQIAGQADQSTLQREQMLQDMLGQQQQGQQGAINNTSAQQNQVGMARYAPYQQSGNAMSQYANTLGRPVVLGDTVGGTGGSSGGGGGGKGLGSTIGGIAGSYFGPVGTAVGSAAGGALDG